MNAENNIPAVQAADVHANSSAFVASLSAAMNPTGEPAVAAPAVIPSQSAIAAPAVVTPAAVPVIEKSVTASEPLKKGFDALEMEKPVEPAKEADVDDTPPDAKTPEAKNAWSAIKTENKTLAAKLAELETEKTRLATEAAKAKQFTEADPEWKTYQEVKAKLEEWKPVIARADYRATDEYHQMVSEPLAHNGEEAWKIAESQKIPHEKMEAFLKELDRGRQYDMLEDMTAELPAWVKKDLDDCAKTIRGIFEVDQRLSDNAVAAAKEHAGMEAQRREKESVERKASEMRAVENSRPRLLKAAELFKMEGETPEVAVDSLVRMAQETPFDAQSVEDKTFAVLASGLVPRMSKQIATLRTQLAQRDAEIASLANAAPRAGISQGNQPTQTGPSDMISMLRGSLANAGIAV